MNSFIWTGRLKINLISPMLGDVAVSMSADVILYNCHVLLPAAGSSLAKPEAY